MPSVRGANPAQVVGRLAPPGSESGLDLIALVGTLRHAQYRSVPEIHAELARRGVPILVRSVAILPNRSDERLALSLADLAGLRRIAPEAGRVILAIDGLRPDVGREVLRAFRDALSGEVLLPESLLSSCQGDLAKLLGWSSGPRMRRSTPTSRPLG